jgi:phosphoserine phosphatase
VVTGLFEPYVEALLARLEGFEAIGTPLAFVDGKLDSGNVAKFNVGRSKAEILMPFMTDVKIFSAYGDSFGDHYMLAASEIPVAVVPDKRLKKVAVSSAWRILSE